jgi:hypothetical protein
MHYCPQNGASITIAVPSNSGLQIDCESIQLRIILGEAFPATGIFRYGIRQTNRRPFSVNRAGP